MSLNQCLYGFYGFHHIVGLSSLLFFLRNDMLYYERKSMLSNNSTAFLNCHFEHLHVEGFLSFYTQT